MNQELIALNKKLRKNRPVIDKDILYSTYENNGVFQICFKSRGCANYLAGQCIMCDYGLGTNITEKEISIAFDNALKESKNKIRALLINTFGSVLDEREISEECFKVLLNKIKNTDIDRIIFETHAHTITKEKLDLIRSELKNKRISFELGFESSSEKIRENNLLKYVDNKLFSETINLLHSYNMSVIVNLLVGTPFLSTKEQLNDVLNSIKWCEERNVDEIDLFPVNIKPYTLLSELYKENKYSPISHWLLIEILNSIPLESLSKIYLAWYGNRELKYEHGETSIFPQSCESCHDLLMIFYAKFISNSDVNFRKELIKDLINSAKCNCYKNILKEIQ